MLYLCTHAVRSFKHSVKIYKLLIQRLNKKRKKCAYFCNHQIDINQILIQNTISISVANEREKINAAFVIKI